MRPSGPTRDSPGLVSDERRIGHLDMDAFFAAVEQLDEPAYRGRPVVVGGLGPRGVVATASYEARTYGIHSAMPMAVAKRRCPDGVFVSARFARYKELSDRMRRVLREVSPVIETISLDEAFFDVSRHGTDHMALESLAKRIKRDVRNETGLTCSIGIAANRFLAKLGSEFDKPDGLLVIDPESVQALLDPLPIGALWGVGQVTERRLRSLGLLRVGDLRRAPTDLIVREFGSGGKRLQELASGIDDTPLARQAESRSISRERTFPFDVVDPTEIAEHVARLAVEVVGQLRRESLLCRTVRVKVRYPDFRTITRQARLGVGTDSIHLIAALAGHLLKNRVRLDESGIRLIGVGVGDLIQTEAQQLPLFDEAMPFDAA